MAHGHSHGGCEHEATDDDHAAEMGIKYSLYQKINIANLECLNEETESSGKLVFKPFEERLDFDRYVLSDEGPELLFRIPFTGNIKIKGLIVMGNCEHSHPNRMRLFKNRPNMSFDDVGIKADQEFDLEHDINGLIEYSTRVVTFASVYHLTIHFPSNFGCDKTCIYYIGLRGEFSQAHNHGVTICNYEVMPKKNSTKTRKYDSVHQPIQ